MSTQNSYIISIDPLLVRLCVLLERLSTNKKRNERRQRRQVEIDQKTRNAYFAHFFLSLKRHRTSCLCHHFAALRITNDTRKKMTASNHRILMSTTYALRVSQSFSININIVDGLKIELSPIFLCRCEHYAQNSSALSSPSLLSYTKITYHFRVLRLTKIIQQTRHLFSHISHHMLLFYSILFCSTRSLLFICKYLILVYPVVVHTETKTNSRWAHHCTTKPNFFDLFLNFQTIERNFVILNFEY